MASPGSTTELLGYIAYELSLIQPLIPTYLHLLVAALFPIYTGAHASLARPSSAAKPPKQKQDTDEDESGEETGQKMEGLSPTDAIMFPLLAGTTLAVLYFFLKWLEDPAVLNKILNWYFSGFGVLSVARLLTDGVGVATSFIFPSRYVDQGVCWHVNNKRLVAERSHTNEESLADTRQSPLPGVLGRISLPKPIINALWVLRTLPNRKLRVQVYVRSLIETDLRIGFHGFTAIALAIAAVAYFNLVSKPWWLTNLLGFGFSYSALQFMSPTTFWTGTLILSSLFVYDIYFVFFTPLMVTVATKLDIPIKLLFPRPPGPDADPTKQSLSMLGLGDVVLPGIMIGLALRFDLCLFYLRKQTQRATETINNTETNTQEGEPEAPDGSETKITRAMWHTATGNWGERFWTGWSGVGTNNQRIEGGIFPKTYFHASLCGYILGMLVTLGVMQIASHAQPALLYLVPGVLGSLWGTALVRGELKEMWEYTEAGDDDEDMAKGKGKEQSKVSESIFSLKRAEKTAKRLEQALRDGNTAENGKPGDTEATAKAQKVKKSSKDGQSRHEKRDLVLFSISLPPPPHSTKMLAETPASSETPLTSLEDESRLASAGRLDLASTSGSSSTSETSSPRQSSTAAETKEPVEKRRRLD